MINVAEKPYLEQLDDGSVAIYLYTPGPKVVLLQAYFELYECVGVVRTLDIRSSLVCVVTTSSLLEDCLEILEQVKTATCWEFAPRPDSGPNSEPGPAKKEWLTAARREYKAKAQPEVNK